MDFEFHGAFYCFRLRDENQQINRKVGNSSTLKTLKLNTYQINWNDFHLFDLFAFK